MNEQVKNIKNPTIRRIADECTYRSVGDFGLTIVGGVKLEKFAQEIIRGCVKLILSDCNEQLKAGATINLGVLHRQRTQLKNILG